MRAIAQTEWFAGCRLNDLHLASSGQTLIAPSGSSVFAAIDPT
jgi:hypothetical protein